MQREHLRYTHLPERRILHTLVTSFATHRSLEKKKCHASVNKNLIGPRSPVHLMSFFSFSFFYPCRCTRAYGNEESSFLLWQKLDPSFSFSLLFPSLFVLHSIGSSCFHFFPREVPLSQLTCFKGPKTRTLFKEGKFQSVYFSSLRSLVYYFLISPLFFYWKFPLSQCTCFWEQRNVNPLN